MITHKLPLGLLVLSLAISQVALAGSRYGRSSPSRGGYYSSPTYRSGSTSSSSSRSSGFNTRTAADIGTAIGAGAFFGKRAADRKNASADDSSNSSGGDYSSRFLYEPKPPENKPSPVPQIIAPQTAASQAVYPEAVSPRSASPQTVYPQAASSQAAAPQTVTSNPSAAIEVPDVSQIETVYPTDYLKADPIDWQDTLQKPLRDDEIKLGCKLILQSIHKFEQTGKRPPRYGEFLEQVGSAVDKLRKARPPGTDLDRYPVAAETQLKNAYVNFVRESKAAKQAVPTMSVPTQQLIKAAMTPPNPEDPHVSSNMGNETTQVPQSSSPSSNSSSDSTSSAPASLSSPVLTGGSWAPY